MPWCSSIRYVVTEELASPGTGQSEVLSNSDSSGILNQEGDELEMGSLAPIPSVTYPRCVPHIPPEVSAEVPYPMDAFC